jgi:hypothetical protein
MRGTFNIIDATPGTGPGFWIQTDPGVNGRIPSTPNISSRDVLGVINNGEDLGTITFNVPLTTAQNFYYTLTNTIFQWNEVVALRWYYEFKQLYDKLTFDYYLMYIIKNHKINRVNIINELSKLKNNRLYLQHTDALKNPAYKKHSPIITHINTNSIVGDTDFSDISCVPNHQGYMDVFFRVLPKAKMQILCESWSWNNKEFTSQYLSEKTFGLLFSGIPFISTHEYPLQMIEKMLDVPPHPFCNESKRCKTNGKLFAEFVDKFLQNFDENYKLCKEWSDLVHNKIMYKIENENSLLDLIIEGGLKTEFVVKKTLI